MRIPDCTANSGGPMAFDGRCLISKADGAKKKRQLQPGLGNGARVKGSTFWRKAVNHSWNFTLFHRASINLEELKCTSPYWLSGATETRRNLSIQGPEVPAKT
jgi:hypothetical protein